MASLQDLWKQGCRILEKETEISPSPFPPVQSITDIMRAMDNMGRESFTAVLKILTEKEAPQEAIAIWLCTVWSLKHETICSEAINDFGMALASTRLTSEHDIKRWQEVWQLIAPKQKITPNLVYYPAELFSAIFQVGGTNGFKKILRDVLRYVRSGSEILLTDYVKLMIRRYRQLEQELTEIDKRILQVILDNPDKGIKELARLTRVTPSYFSQRANILREKQVLLEFDHVPFSKIGIRMFNVLLRSQYSKKDALHVIERAPFLYGYRPVLAGNWDIIALFCIPETWLISRWLHRFEKLAKLWGVTVTISEIIQSGAAMSLRYYRPDGGGWYIPWSALGLWCETRLDWKRQVGKIHLTPYGRKNIRLDELDMKILMAVMGKITRFKAIRKAVGAGQNVVAARIRALRKNGFITKYIQVLHVGLREGAMIETRDSETREILLRLGPKLPRTIISMDRKSRVIMTTNLPEGGNVELLRSLRSREHTFSFAFLGDNIYGGWEIPKYSWNPDTQSWRVPNEEVEQWLDGLR